LTWRQNEEGEQKLRVKGGETRQTVNRAGAAFFGAPVDAQTGQALASASLWYAFAGGWEGCAGKSWARIQAEGIKRHKEGGKTGNTTMVANLHQAALVEHHSHICRSSLCVRRCTPSTDARGNVRMVHKCMDPLKSTQ